MADQELRRMSNITTQTLRFHQQATAPKAVTCDDLIHGALLIFQGRMLSSGIEVQKRKRAHEPVTCLDGEIRQVLNNLIGNAVDAMTSGGRLLLRSREATSWTTGARGLIITVADTGAGMSPKTVKKVSALLALRTKCRPGSASEVSDPLLLLLISRVLLLGAFRGLIDL